MIEFTNFTDIAKSASRHTARFTIGVQQSLKALKSWIEDMLRMSKLLVAVDFTSDVLYDYIQLYIAAVATKVATMRLLLDLNSIQMIGIHLLLEQKCALALFKVMVE